MFSVNIYFSLSDVDKIKVINKLEFTHFESNFALHENALVSEVFAFYFKKSNIHFAIFINNILKKFFN